jgi:hypothetical protein
MEYKTEEINAIAINKSLRVPEAKVIAFARAVQLPDVKFHTTSFQREILIGAEKVVKSKIRPRSGQILPPT